MTHGVPKGYDPAWRAVQGTVQFDPPPAALLDAQRVPSYAVAGPPPATDPAAEGQRERGSRGASRLSALGLSAFGRSAPRLSSPRLSAFGLSALGLLALGLAGLVAHRQSAPGTEASSTQTPSPQTPSPQAASTLTPKTGAPSAEAPRLAATLPAQFTIPLLILRAAGPGTVVAVVVADGQPVEPETPLLTFRPAGADAVQTVLAGLHGAVHRLEARPGSMVQAADPLVLLADCSRAFLVVRESGRLHAGQDVGIRLPGLPPFRGLVRRSAGPAEPDQALVVDAAGLAAVALAGCPAAGAAEILP